MRDIVRIARDGGRKTAFETEPTSDDKTAIPTRPGNLFFTTDVGKSIAEADIVLVAVNTPTKYRGVGAGSATDMTAFEAVTGVVAQYAREGAIIVEKSTVPCRTAQLVADTVSNTSEDNYRSRLTNTARHAPPWRSLRNPLQPRVFGRRYRC